MDDNAAGLNSILDRTADCSIVWRLQLACWVVSVDLHCRWCVCVCVCVWKLKCDKWRPVVRFCRVDIAFTNSLTCLLLSSYSAPDRGVDWSIILSVSACVCVCLSAIISSELHVRSLRSILCMLPMVVARSCYGGIVIRYVLPVLWMTSYLIIRQGCSTSPPSWSGVHTQLWAWL